MFKHKNLLLTVAAALTLQCTVSANDIEPGKEFYTAIKAPAPIVLDGDLSEWRGASLLADPRFSIPKGSGDDGELVFFEPYSGGSWDGPDDQTSAVQVVYDDDNVYFGFTVTDEYHENAANSAWNGDSIQLMIANEARDQQVALYNYALGGTDEEIGDIIVNHESKAADMGDVVTEAVVIRNTENGRTVYEIKLPKATLGLAELKGGVRFGLGMAINDGDKDTPGQKGWGGLGAHAIVFGKTPQETALVTLATSNDIEPGKEYYTANPTPGDIALDGELNDWTGVPVLSDPRFSIPKGSKRTGELVLFEPYGGGSWSGPDDQTSAVQIAYDADNVYFGFVVTDEYHENAANSAWNGDSIQLMIANKNQDEQIALYNYALGGTEMEIGDIIVNHESGPAAGADAVAVTEAVVKRNTETKRTTYEIKLPKETLGLDSLALGTQFGLGMAINDGDEDTPGQKGWGGLGAHSIVFGKTPSETALVTLGIGGGSSDSMFLSAINVSINSFTFRASDKGESIVAPDSAKLTINGNTVALTAGAKNVDATDFAYTIDGNFEPSTVIEYLIEIADTNGNVVTDTGTITSPTFGLLKAAMLASDVDTSKKGFTYKVWQSDLFSHGNTIAEVENVLAEAPKDIDGSTLDNDAFKDEKGPATASGSEDGHLIAYEIPSVININAFLNGVDLGNFQPDDQMPGVPGNYDSYDGVAVEIVTYVDFPAGLLTMGVNSDDGFELKIGHIDDPRAMVAGKFQGGRGSADTTFLMDVREAGIYPLRLVYFSQGGDASVELFTVNDAGEKVLVNDTANGGLAAYRAGTAPDYVEPAQPAQPAAMVASSSDALTEPTVVDFGALGGDSSYSFHFTAVKAGASTAIAGNNAFAIKLDQWNEQGVFGTTEFGVADNLFTAVEGGSVNSVFDAPVHVVIVSDTAAGESHLYIDGVLSGTWAGNIPFSGETKVMGARLEQATDHMGEGSVMHSWATYSGLLTAAEIATMFEALPDVSTGGGDGEVDLLNGLVALWNFDDGTFNDSVGGFNGEERGAAPIGFTDGPGGYGSALALDGVDQFVEITGGAAEDLTFEGGSMTLSAWFRVGAFDKGWQALIAKGEGDRWRVHRRGGDGSGLAHAGGVGEGPAGADISLGEWHHLVAVTDGDAVEFGTRLYVDGEIYSENAATPSLGENGKRVMIGGNPDTGNRTWNGDIDDIALWDRALSGAEVASLLADGPITLKPTILPLDGVADAGSGLDGRYWQAAPKAVLNLQDKGEATDIGLHIVNNYYPTGTFTATGLDFQGGNDLTPIREWLQGDGESYVGADGNMDDGVLSFTGYIRIDNPGEIAIRSASDDGSIVWIAGQKVVDNDGSHGAPGPSPDGSYNFEEAGLYPIEVAYFNGDWTNDAGEHGGANLGITANGDPIPGAILYSASDIGATAIAASSIAAAAGDAGLHAAYWTTEPKGAQFGEDSQGPIFQNVQGDDHGLALFGTEPQGRFVATTMTYTGNDLTPILEWLGDDSGSFIGTEGNLDDGIFQFTGLLNVAEAGQHSFRSSSDDGSVVRIGNQIVVNNDGGHGSPGPAPDGNAFFPVAGLYPIEVAYFNGDWTNDDGDHGGANIELTMNGESIAGHLLQPAGGLPPIVASGGVSSISLADDGHVVIEFTGSLMSADNVGGPYTAVEGATSPAMIAPDKAAQFYKAE